VRRLQGMEDLAISDVTLDDSQALVTIAGVPDHPGLAAAVFDGIAAGGILVDMIVQSYAGGTPATLSFTVPQEALKETVAVAEKLTARLQCGPVTSSPRIAMLSVSGIGLRSHTGVAIRMFEALAQAGINIDMINTSEVRVTVVVDGAQGAAALKALRAAFADVQR
jgi:aspartate kinase